jgi:integrase
VLRLRCSGKHRRSRKDSELKAKKARYQQGSIRKVRRASGYAWEVRFSETIGGKRKQKSLYFPVDAEYPNETAVRKAIAANVVLANSSSERAKVGASFGDITALYRSEHLPTLRHSTQSTNGYLLKQYIEPQWEETPLHDVTPLKVVGWMRGLSGLAPTTKATIRSIMSVCFNLAALHGYIPATERNPMAVVPIKGTSKREKEIVILTPEQFKNLVAELPAPLNLMALLAGSLGLRVGEVVALHWEDIDWAGKTITIQRNFTRQQVGEPKTESSHAVLPLDELLLVLLEEHQRTTGDSPLMFPSTKTGRYRAAGMLLQDGIQPIAARLNLGHVTWHGLRHSCRSWLDAKGVPVGVQKDLLRHADVSTTMNRYGRALAPEMRSSHSAIMAELIPDAMKR